jgi:ABC-type branched-subunit amino acid transport system substrate-binding protein
MKQAKVLANIMRNYLPMVTREFSNAPLSIKGGLFLCILSLSLSACNGLRKAEGSKPPTKNKPDSQANQGQKPNPNVVLVDTINWKMDSKAKPPITTQTPNAPTGTGSGSTTGGIIVEGSGSGGSGSVYDPKSTGDGSVGTIKNSYDLAILLPFFASQYTEGVPTQAKSQFALDFYAGAKLAIDTLSTSPLSMKVSVLDSKGSSDFNAVMARYDVSRADVILGPVEKENVPAAMEFANRNQKIVFSPYFPTGDVENANPYFLQVKPSLRTHCENIVRHLRTRFKTEQVVLVGRQKDMETSRFKLFQDANSALNQTQYGGRFDEWAIEDETNFSIDAYIQSTGQTVFVVPSWNEFFVSSLLKKIAASPKRANIAVYGMPQWMDFDKSLTNLYANLGVRVSSSTFINGGSEEVKNFRDKFYRKYSKMPTSDAFLGYDCMMYLGKMMMQYGTAFPQYLLNEQQPMLHTRFNFEPVYRSVVSDDDLNGNIAKYENKYVNILRYQGGAFRLEE